MSRIALLSLCVLAGAILGGCRKREPLDAETAMSLLRERTTDPVRFTFSASPPGGDDSGLIAAYARLVDAHVIKCTETKVIGKICEPGPTGEALTLVGSTELSLAAGRWAPGSIVRISKSGDDAATAEVRMNFEPSPLYRDFEATFDTIRQSSGGISTDYRRETKIARATYQRLEDGWHLDAVN